MTVARDNGTREAQAKRDQLINGAPVELIATAAGVLLARGLLSLEQYRAADRFAQARARCYGVPLANSEGGREPTDDRVAYNERKYNALCRRLTPPQLIAVVDLVLGARPVWALRLVARLPLRLADEENRECLLGGLDALAADNRTTVPGPSREPQDERSAPAARALRRGAAAPARRQQAGPPEALSGRRRRLGQQDQVGDRRERAIVGVQPIVDHLHLGLHGRAIGRDPKQTWLEPDDHMQGVVAASVGRHSGVSHWSAPLKLVDGQRRLRHLRCLGRLALGRLCWL
jgi:hypothetical protein